MHTLRVCTLIRMHFWDETTGKAMKFDRALLPLAVAQQCTRCAEKVAREVDREHAKAMRVGRF